MTVRNLNKEEIEKILEWYFYTLSSDAYDSFY